MATAILSTIDGSGERFVYVELGIMQRKHRQAVIQGARERGFRTLPFLLLCDDREAIEARQRRRSEQLGRAGAHGTRIAITMGDLYARIERAFEVPAESEGFISLNNSKDLMEPLEIIGRHVADGDR